MPKLIEAELLLERLLKDVDSVKIDKTHSYHIAYPEFLSYFSKLLIIDKHALVIGAHFVYGWMPTCFDFRKGSFEEINPILNAVRKGHNINIKELELLRSFINNSLVGASKLLHFIAPNRYPIWDSRVHRYLFESHSVYQHSISNVKVYLDFCKVCQSIATNKKYLEKAHSSIQKQLYTITPIRSLELIMFEKGIKHKDSSLQSDK